MAGTQPAAEDDAAWNMAISNLIEVTQTRSVYGQVSNLTLHNRDAWLIFFIGRGIAGIS